MKHKKTKFVQPKMSLSSKMRSQAAFSEKLKTRVLPVATAVGVAATGIATSFYTPKMCDAVQYISEPRGFEDTYAPETLANENLNTDHYASYELPSTPKVSPNILQAALDKFTAVLAEFNLYSQSQQQNLEDYSRTK